MTHDPFVPVVSPEHEASSNGNGRTVAVVVVAVVVAAVLVVGVIGAVWFLNRDGDGLAAAATASPTPEQSASPSPTPDVSEEPTSLSPTPTVPEASISPAPAPEVDEDALARAEALGFSPVAYDLGIEEIHDHYSELQTSLELFQDLIPATEEGAEYVYAFMTAVTDYKSAARFGATFDGAARDEFAALELQFLTVSDMDVDISLTQSDGTMFVHDGTAPRPAD